MDLIQRTVLTPELLAEIRRLQFYARRLADQGVSGKYRSAFKGQGIEFQEVREYVPGDDIRAIDWKVTARSRKPFVKSYQEERELTVVVAVDVSASTRTGTKSQLRAAMIAKLAAVLTLIALKNNDKVGLITFSDRIQTYHPPRKARSSIWRILHEVLAPASFGGGTNFEEALMFLHRVQKRPAIMFIVSDFIGTGLEAGLALLGKRHDVTAAMVVDPSEAELPSAGLITLRDPESGRAFLADTDNERFRKSYLEMCSKSREELRSVFRRFRIGTMEIASDRPFMIEVKRYFDSRRHGRFVSGSKEKSA